MNKKILEALCDLAEKYPDVRIKYKHEPMLRENRKPDLLEITACITIIVTLGIIIYQTIMG